MGSTHQRHRKYFRKNSHFNINFFTYPLLGGVPAGRGGFRREDKVGSAHPTRWSK